MLHNNIVKDYQLNKNKISNKHANSSQCLGAEYFDYQHAYVCSSSFIVSAFTFNTSFSLFFFSFSESFLRTSSTHDCFMLQHTRLFYASVRFALSKYITNNHYIPRSSSFNETVCLCSERGDLNRSGVSLLNL